MRNNVQLQSGKELTFTSNSSREVKLQHHPLSIVKIKRDDNNEIIAIDVDGFDISLNSILKIQLFDANVVPFKVANIIHGRDKVSYFLKSTILTKACRWIMPMLRDKHQTYASMKYKKWFINCYVGTKEEGYMPFIYLVYRYSGSTEYQFFEEELKSHQLYDSMMDLDRHHVMYIFKMTEEYKEIFNLFINGKYSAFPNDYKKQILNFVIDPIEYPTEADIKGTVTYGALYKTKLQRDRIELLINPNPESKVRVTLPDDIDLFSIPEEQYEVYDGSIEIPNDTAITSAKIEDFENNNEEM